MSDAILRLLSDPDPVLQATLRKQLLADPALLDRTWTAAIAESAEPPEVLCGIVLAADAQRLVDAFGAVGDLAGGVWLLPQLLRPRHDWRSQGEAAIAGIAARILAEHPVPHGGHVAIALSGLGFTGDRVAYHDPANSFLPQVLERRCGLPIALSALWLLVCRALRCEAEAVALPGHVVGRWLNEGSPAYVDGFAGFRALSRADLDVRCRAVGEPSASPYLVGATDRTLLRRMARNLLHSYAQRGDRLRATIAQGMAAA